MISLVTAVVSDNVIQATQDRKEKQKEARQTSKKKKKNRVFPAGNLSIEGLATVKWQQLADVMLMLCKPDFWPEKPHQSQALERRRKEFVDFLKVLCLNLFLMKLF